ncbi:hypothetical protein UA08_03034 [Talaromyces atroroseus]|uniref:Uncharacterized protein n=1 Tax=Talaromyces atroroseus TaxID=1441469 RepID=A0A225B4Y0_TALAT|nr:hypothetical protein UA08_03034 [Talaromyces atroroseus]OKL62316.1 hypothetical protein UA08_03034 [Talaromyces atroroseus]
MSRHTPKRTRIPVIVHDGNSSIAASESMTVPSLSTGSPSSVSGRSNESLNNVVVNLLDTDSTGNLVAPAEQPPVVFRCLFHMLPCDYQSDSLEQWQTHVLSHFRGCRLPPVASCSWCAVDFGGETAARTWTEMLEHVAHEHFEKGHTLAASRPNFELMKYMYQSKIITEDQLKAVQLCPSPDSPAYHPSQDAVRASIGSSDEPYCSTYSPRREKRLREQRHGISVV